MMKGVMSVGYDINSILGEVLLGGCVAVGAVCSILNSCIRHLVHIGPCEPDLVCRVTSRGGRTRLTFTNQVTD